MTRTVPVAMLLAAIVAAACGGTERNGPPAPERVGRTALRLESAGLTATYFDDTHFGHAVLTRVEPSVDAAWGGASPAPGVVPADGFSVRWSGTLVATATERVTFFLKADDGARLFVDDQLVVDGFDGGPGETQGDLSLVAGRRYAIRVEAFESSGDAEARLEWSTPSRPRAVVPAARFVTAIEPSGLDLRPANPTCVAPPRPQAGPGAVRLQRALGGATFTLPLAFVQEPGGGRILVVEKGGKVKAFPPGGGSSTTFVDVSGKVSATSNEAGLLGMALHPAWPARKEVFLSYTAPSATAPSGLRSVVARYVSTDGGATLAVPARADEIFSLDQPFTNHNGGNIAFGADGFLYLGLGDGGSGGDPHGNAQNRSVLLGKMLRIDPETLAPGKKYGIPPGNPFGDEIFALGLRNPWRFSFDREAPHALWAGDVGQDKYEEIDVITAGGNYGWNVREGAACYGATTCRTTGFVEPAYAYGRADGYAVTGGYVYRGAAMPWLRGAYVFGDFGSGKVWALRGGQAQKIADTGMNIASFGEDDAGELYVLDYAGGGVHRIVPDLGTARPFPARLSDTGCFDAQDPGKPAAGVLGYDVVAPLWSDGADKRRYVAIPDGETIDVGADGDFDLPVGSVAIKTFLVGGHKVETRLFVRHDDGQWAGYSYAWNAAETDAVLVDDAGKTTAGWTFPSRAQCMQCHTGAAGRTLGLELAQLNREFTYAPPVGGPRTANQLATWEHIGLLAQPLALPPSASPRLATYGGTDTVERRARSWLHANCSQCHRPGGGGGTGDWRFTTPLADVGVCDVAASHGSVGGASVLFTPGDPAASVLSQRVRTTGAARMPPLGTRVVDVQGADLLDAWITSVAACP